MCGSMVVIQSGTAEIREEKEERRQNKLECRSMPNAMAALPNI